MTGEAGFDADRSAAVEGLDGTLLAITGVLVLVLMLLTYRSPLIAALMLGVVAVAYLIATGLVYGLVQADVTTVSGQSTAILIVLMFGAGTDYCLLIVSRFRDELRRVGDVEAAMTRAASRARARRSSPRAGSSSPRCSCSRSPTSTRRARWARCSRSGSS